MLSFELFESDLQKSKNFKLISNICWRRVQVIDTLPQMA